MEGITNHAPAVPLLRVSITTPQGDREFKFTRPFRIGRTEECDVCIPDQYVSRFHAEVAFEADQWSIRDLHSSNGIFVDGQRRESSPINGPIKVRLGIKGPFVSLTIDALKPQAAPLLSSETKVARYIDRYFGKSADESSFGEHTILLRQAFKQVRRKQEWRYWAIFGVLALIILASLTYAFYERQVAVKQKAFAEDIFYSMKSLDVDIANVEKLVTASNNQAGMQEVRKYQNRRKAMERNYDTFVATLHVYDPKLTQQQRLILRVARIFGECELNTPPAFVTEINSHIARWKSSGRLAKALATAKDKGYTVRIADELLAQDLPPQFFYLALQESDFNPYSSGPVTRSGIAKGMWQFIPETAMKYGLRIGPLADLQRVDPGDDRHHWELETKAAARYIKDLYGTDAQASGLLVMACYNWGENRVIPLVRSMPSNPRDRNFWRLLAAHGDQIPKETYDYVFYIVSAAVIGENPRLFGFDFDNPLAHLGG